MKLKKIKKFFVTKELFIAYFILLLILTGTSLAFLFQNNSYTWDTYAHIDSAKFVLENSWPSPVVWNPDYFNGYPQNYFYPPLLSFIVATLGFVFGAELAYKLFVIFLYFCIPIVGYLFARIFQPRENALTLNLIFVTLFFVQDIFYFGRIVGIGGTVFSTFYVGLAPALLGTSLLLLFIYLFENKFDVKILGIIFALGVLSHYIFLLAIIYLFFKNIFEIKKENVIKSFLVFLIGSLLSAWWFIPAIVNSYYSKTAPFIIPFLNMTTFLVFLGTISGVFFKLNKEKIFVAISISIIIFLTMFYELLQGQLFRVYFVISLFSIPAIYLVSLKFFNYNNITKKIFKLAPILMVIIIFILSLQIEFTTITDVEIDEINSQDGIKIVLGPTNFGEIHHALFYEVSKMDHRVQRGLFSEQTPNIVFFNGVSLLINPNEFVWGTYSVKREAIKTENFIELMNYLGVSSIITTENISPEFRNLPRKKIGRQLLKKEQTKILWFSFNPVYIEIPIYEYILPQTELVEIINYPPSYYLGDDWEYFSNVYLTQHTLVATNKQITNFNIDTDAKIKNLERTHNKISFFVDSNVNVPVFIKESYFPNWKAYSNGEEIEIFVTAPYFMMINSKGNIELVYENSSIEIISFYISLLTTIILIFFILKKARYKKVFKLKKTL